MNNTTQQIFGNYFLLQEIAAGGMAEIYLARPADSEANGRIFVLKRILPQVTQDPEFIRMFQSEIQVTMGFHHTNLVQIFDFGKCQGRHFIAMEYIEGKNLRELTLKFISMGQMIPVPAAVSLVAQAAAGLQYAHEYKNHVTGESMNIVHRDVSPQNILVSYDGTVKIIDFGIAKSESPHADKTRVGCIKGKLSYLSPEQLYQQELDGRSDIFSLGAVLWELLAGQKLFHQIGQSDMGILDAIAHCENVIVAPSVFNDNVPAELDEIVLKALAKDRENRFASADDFHRALNRFLQKIQPGYDQRSLGLVIKETFESELEEERRNIKTLNQQAQLQLEKEEQTARIAVTAAASVTRLAMQTPEPTAVTYSGSDIPGLAMTKIPAQPPSRPYSYSQGSNPHLAAPEYGQPAPHIVYVHEPAPQKKPREQFYVKLTFGRALALMAYAATLLVLRLDHDQVVLNAIFGRWDSQAAQLEKLPVSHSGQALATDSATFDDSVSDDVAQGEVLARTKLIKKSANHAQKLKVAQRVPATKVAKSVLLRIRLVRKSGPAATAILVNQNKLDLTKPSIQVVTNQQFWVQVQRKGARPLMKSVQLKPELVGLAQSYDLNVYLY